MQPFTILIPTARRTDLIRRTLESLLACEMPEAMREVVVVENGPKCGSEAVVGELASRAPVPLRYMHVERPNKSHALNVAMETIETDWIVFFDDDVRIDRNALMEYARVFERDERDVYYGGSFGVDYEEEPVSWIRDFLPLSARGVIFADDEVIEKHDEVLGCNWAARRSDLEAAGGFNESFGPGSPTGAVGQESDMMRRLMERGLRARPVSRAMVWHYVPRSRCNPEWLLERKKKAGVSSGLYVATQRSRRRLVVYLVKSTRRTAQYLAARAGVALRGGVRPEEFERYMLLTREFGFAKGLFLGLISKHRMEKRS